MAAVAQDETNSTYQQIEEPKGFVKDASAQVRLGFVRKVYGILTVQVLLTTLVAAPIQTMGKAAIQSVFWILPFSAFVTIAIICAMSCKPQLGKSYPTNYILLFAFTFFEAITIGVFTSAYTAGSVAFVLGLTTLIFGGLTAYACTTKNDFTGLMPYLFGFLIALCIFGFGISIAGAFGFDMKPLMMVYSFCGVVLFMFYIIFDTQRILGSALGGGHDHEFEVDEYVFAAITLYLDLLNLFIYLMQLFGDRK